MIEGDVTTLKLERTATAEQYEFLYLQWLPNREHLHLEIYTEHNTHRMSKSVSYQITYSVMSCGILLNVSESSAQWISWVGKTIYESFIHLPHTRELYTLKVVGVKNDHLVSCIRSEVFTSVTKKNVFRNVTPCGSFKYLQFGGNYRLHHHGENNRRARNKVISN
jgi:hypothetical protein